MALDAQTKIAVIGAGTMGSGIAEVAARHGHRVVVIDQQSDALARSQAAIEKNLEGQVAKGRLTPEARDEVRARLSWQGDLLAVADAGLVIEAIVERPDAKAKLFAALEAIVAPNAILATNTSSLSVENLASTFAQPARFIGLHFFNPVPVMKLVEVIPSAVTAPGLVDDSAALMRAWGKSPARVRDVPGFIVNRVARPYYAEAFAAWRDGIDPVEVDALLVEAGGFRMGPLALADMIGHDINYAVAASIFEGYGDKARFRLQPNQRALVEAGRLGRKTGAGVHDYGSLTREVATIAPGLPVETVQVGSVSNLLAPLLDRLAQASVGIEQDPSLEADQLRLPGGAVLAVTDGRRMASRDDCSLLLDIARDYSTTSLLGLTFEDADAAARAAALFEKAGIRLVALPDRPGLLVLRTLAQLANAAADALDDEIASAEDIGTAMRHGANHPESPLGWVLRIGNKHVDGVLEAIAGETGDAMYRPSPSLSPVHVSA